MKQMTKLYLLSALLFCGLLNAQFVTIDDFKKPNWRPYDNCLGTWDFRLTYDGLMNYPQNKYHPIK